MARDDDARETLVCIRKTATRHKRGEGNRGDRNFRATSLEQKEQRDDDKR